MPNPSCFLSYSRDGTEHEAWVRLLGTRLMQSGVATRLDQWDLVPGADLLHYMETSVRESDFVVLVCTPAFARKANAAAGGVGYEKAIVSAAIFENALTGKFIPLLRSGTEVESLPSYLKSRVYIDFRDDTHFDKRVRELLRVIHGQPLFTRPDLGPVPSPDPEATAPADTAAAPVLGAPAFSAVFEFAWKRDGLNLQSRKTAASWASAWIASGRSHDDLGWFGTLYAFAYSSRGLNCATDQEALEWAETLFVALQREEFVQFKERFAFANGKTGLRMMRLNAARWALANLHSDH